MTQALAVVKLQQRAGLTLAGIVTDEDASPAILEEIIAPLNVPILILPSIKLVDGVKGMVPLPAVMVNIIQVQGQLQALHGKITAFLADARPGLLLSFWHITFAFFLQNFARPPPEMKVVHTAAQFALVQELDLAELRVPLEVVTMATASVMTGIFCSTGQTAPISPSPSPRALPPILEVPPVLQPGSPRPHSAAAKKNGGSPYTQHLGPCGRHPHPLASTSSPGVAEQTSESPRRRRLAAPAAVGMLVGAEAAQGSIPEALGDS